MPLELEGIYALHVGILSSLLIQIMLDSFFPSLLHFGIINIPLLPLVFCLLIFFSCSNSLVHLFTFQETPLTNLNVHIVACPCKIAMLHQDNVISCPPTLCPQTDPMLSFLIDSFACNEDRWPSKSTNLGLSLLHWKQLRRLFKALAPLQQAMEIELRLHMQVVDHCRPITLHADIDDDGK